MRAEPPSSLIEYLERRDPSKDVLYTAIEVLKDPADIVAFVDEYLERKQAHSQEEGAPSREQALAAVNAALNHYDSDIVRHWFEHVPLLSKKDSRGTMEQQFRTDIETGIKTNLLFISAFETAGQSFDG